MSDVKRWCQAITRIDSTTTTAALPEVVLASDYDQAVAQIVQLRHDRDVLAENLHDVRSAVWRTGMNAILQRHNDRDASHGRNQEEDENGC